MAIMTLAGCALENGIDIFASDVEIEKKDDSSGIAFPAQWFLESFGAVSNSGASVTPETALRLATVDACVSVLAESLALLPLEQWREVADGKERDVAHPNYEVISRTPNQWQTSFEFREQMMVDVLLTGNAYAEIITNQAGYVMELRPITPSQMKVVRQGEDGRIYYAFFDPRRQAYRMLSQDEMLHIRGKSRDGIVGMSVISAHRETLGLAMVAEEYGARLFSNGANMGGFFELPPHMSDPAERANFIKYLQSRHTGVQNANRFGVLESGTKFHQTSISPEDAQFLELRRYQKEEICSIFRVPPHMVGDLSRSTNNNIEHQSLEFVTRSLMPWLRRWEQALERDLLSWRERQTRSIRFDVAELLRGDLKSQAEFYAAGRQWGWFSVNDVRRRLNENSIGASGDRYLEPVNMVEAGGEKNENRQR